MIYSKPSIFSETTIEINSKPRGNTTFRYWRKHLIDTWRSQRLYKPKQV
jgi:hypothetical protein